MKINEYFFPRGNLTAYFNIEGERRDFLLNIYACALSYTAISLPFYFTIFISQCYLSSKETRKLNARARLRLEKTAINSKSVIPTEIAISIAPTYFFFLSFLLHRQLFFVGCRENNVLRNFVARKNIDICCETNNRPNHSPNSQSCRLNSIPSRNIAASFA